MSLLSEIFEQPAVLASALQANRGPVMEAAGLFQKASFAVIAARGTSDNAARYAKYLWGAHNRLPVALAAPSLFSLYGQPPEMRGALVVGISQSGHSPDIIAVLQEGRRQGCPTLAITNAPRSPLAEVANFVLDIGAGEEQAVAASKTYSAQLLAIAMLSAAAAGESSPLDELEKTPGWMRECLGHSEAIAAAVHPYTKMRHCVVLGRGYNYATAYEWSLKLKELAYVVAEPHSSADLQHGPIALIERGFPVLAVAPAGMIAPGMQTLLQHLKRNKQARLLTVSNLPELLDLADEPVPLPAGIPEWISPLVAIVPAQLFCYHLTQARGLDTDNPRGLHKVTLTK